jgi:hypothetical protein
VLKTLPVESWKAFRVNNGRKCSDFIFYSTIFFSKTLTLINISHSEDVGGKDIVMWKNVMWRTLRKCLEMERNLYLKILFVRGCLNDQN